ncbi:MAG: hypothetical protein LBK58_12420, partial [Prevotellaceae bacterium]|nr:hypothetical protein [Prevotellaceae bacterium]
MQTRLFFRIIFGFIFLIGNQHIQAQNYDARIETEVDGSTCGKATLTINVKADGCSNLDISKCKFVINIAGNSNLIDLPVGQNKAELAPGFRYAIRAVNVKCNGQESKCRPDTVMTGLKMTDVEYKRSSDSDISVSATVSGGKSPYKYQLIANGKDIIESGSSTGNKISFSATTSSSDLELKVSDEECPENGAVSEKLLPQPNVESPAYICLNSNPVSLSKYVSKTSSSYTLIWYRSDGSLIGTDVPVFNPNLPGPSKYLVSQKNTAGVESSRAELTLIVEELPAKIGNNYIVCLSDALKPVIRVINAGNNTYNLYTAHSGGTKTGFGTAINDTAIIKTAQDLIAGSIYYIETENVHGCISYDRATVSIQMNESLILGPEKICFGDRLSLSTDYAGGKITWTMPDNSHYEGATLKIDSVSSDNAGTYSLLIEESGLSCVMRDEIQVKVTQPAPPYVAENSFRYYRDEKAPALTATPKEGLVLKWYGPDGKLLSQAPVPLTDKEGIFTYHVSQDSLACESPKVPITVIVGTIPDAVSASDINICIADKPEIQIKNTVQDYKYTVSLRNSVIAEGTGNGNAISLISKVSITENAEVEIMVSDIYGVKSPVTKKNVTVPASLIVESASAFCLGSDFQLNAIDIAGAGYTWTLPSGSEYSGKSLPITDAKSEDSGIYTLAVTTSGCPVVNVTKRVNVSQPAPPKVDKDSYRFHENETATPLTATPKQGCTLKWYNPEGALLPGQSPVPATGKVGAFVYNVSQDSLGCE